MPPRPLETTLLLLLLLLVAIGILFLRGGPP
jgi:hypothetical protein